MKHLRKVFLMVLLMAIVAFNAASAFLSSSPEGGSYLTYGEEEEEEEDGVSGETQDQSSFETLNPAASLRGAGRFLTQAASSRAVPTCDKYPRICRDKGSPGPDCCKKKCVNVSADRLNCGMCGHKCKYSEICCRGQCVNPMSDKKHCGGCNNKCNRKKGSSSSSCVYGMCSYA
ncbi:stigma-specific STIG1-like protein 3 [Rhodamnia argentea]|uniref:Stigma-specific STIG1-like protein 3 n=1 Tax=Rhodamnia argentea TaxID=178133 RepID=A0A8B8R344_9MYRT|nr:stigma-specific STIG1-like protein 3 [Rhodamnia argentea]